MNGTYQRQHLLVTDTYVMGVQSFRASEGILNSVLMERKSIKDTCGTISTNIAVAIVVYGALCSVIILPDRMRSCIKIQYSQYTYRHLCIIYAEK